jgi:uncharacterized protein (DUF2147 family)
MHALCRKRGATTSTGWRSSKCRLSFPIPFPMPGLLMRKVMRPAAVLLLISIAAAIGAAPNSAPEGYWLTEKHDGVIEIFRCAGDMLCGKLAWFRIKPDDPNPQALDLKNPDPAKRSQSLCGLVFMTGFRPVAADRWEDGTIYDPDSGNTYHGTMQLRAGGTLDLHGYIGISLIGRSEIWTRYAEKPPPCPTR